MNSTIQAGYQTIIGSCKQCSQELKTHQTGEMISCLQKEIEKLQNAQENLRKAQYGPQMGTARDIASFRLLARDI